MPQFFFHVHGEKARLDCKGKHLRDARAALHWAMAEARHLMSETLRQGRVSLHDWIEIADAQGITIARVPFLDAAAASGRRSAGRNGRF